MRFFLVCISFLYICFEAPASVGKFTKKIFWIRQSPLFLENCAISNLWVFCGSHRIHLGQERCAVSTLAAKIAPSPHWTPKLRRLSLRQGTRAAPKLVPRAWKMANLDCFGLYFKLRCVLSRAFVFKNAKCFSGPHRLHFGPENLVDGEKCDIFFLSCAIFIFGAKVALLGRVFSSLVAKVVFILVAKAAKKCSRPHCLLLGR